MPYVFLDEDMAPNDLKDVAAWLKCSENDVNIRTESVGIASFENHINSCLQSYADFPEEERRMRRILKRLQKGEKPFPIFVEDGDTEMFIMEGRHRIVAFFEFGLKDIEVAFVSSKSRIDARKRQMPR